MRTTRPRIRSSRSGFTLLELLLATAVGAVVLIAIQTTFFGALRLHNTTHARIDEETVVDRALGIVRKDFSGILLPGGTLSGELQSSTFSSSMTGNFGDPITPEIFTSSGRIDGWNPFSEAQMVVYYLGPANNGQAGRDLIRVATRNLLPVQEATVEDRVLLQGVASATVTFYDGQAWMDSWDSTTTSTLPSAIKLSLVMAPHEGGAANLAPIEVIVPILVTTTTSQTQAEEEGAGL